MFQEFIEKKESDKFNKSIIEACRDYAQLMQIGTNAGEQIFKIVINPDAKKTICFVAGLHGNEKGGPYGVLEFLKKQPHIPKTKRIVILPLVNPTGFSRNQRKTSDNIDLNRHFRNEPMRQHVQEIWDAIKEEDMIVLHTLHEDPRLESWYCYHTDLNEVAKDLRDLAKKYFPIYSKDRREPLSKDQEEGKLWGDKIYNGLIPLPHEKTDCLEDKVWIEEGIPYIVTETPGQAPIKKRSEYNCKAMKLVINNF